jgi:hypothetical protein
VGAVYLLAADRTTLGRIDASYSQLETIRRWSGIDSFTMSIDRRRLYADLIAAGRYLYLDPEDELYLIEQVQFDHEGEARELTVAGRSVDGFALTERHVIPPVDDSHDRQASVPAETAIKHYVGGHAGAAAGAARALPGLVVAADLRRGPTVTTAARFQPLVDVVRELALLSGLGWRTTLDRAANELLFDVLEGTDRSASVFFDFDFETLESWHELISLLNSKTVAYVAGQGEGTARDVVVRWQGTEPTGFERRELFVDARDVELGETALLDQRGDAVLADRETERALEVTIHPYGSFRYRRDWDLGDLVLAQNRELGVGLTARVVEVRESREQSAEASSITAALGRPLPAPWPTAGREPIVDQPVPA